MFLWILSINNSQVEIHQSDTMRAQTKPWFIVTSTHLSITTAFHFKYKNWHWLAGCLAKKHGMYILLNCIAFLSQYSNLFYQIFQIRIWSCHLQLTLCLCFIWLILLSFTTQSSGSNIPESSWQHEVILTSEKEILLRTFTPYRLRNREGTKSRRHI